MRVQEAATSGVAVLPASPRLWRRMSVTSVIVWCLVGAFIAKSCIPRSVDLFVYRDAARDMLHGGTIYLSSFTTQHLPFTYPPFALFAFSPLTAMSSTSMAWVWDAVNVLALVAGLVVAIRRSLLTSWRRAVVVATLVAGASCLVFEPLRSSLLDGQVNFILFAAVVTDVLAVPPRARGVLVGLAGAVKLTPLVFVVYFLAARERAAALRAIGAFAVATTIGWVVLPSDSSTFWLQQAFSPSRRGAARSASNQSFWGLVGRLPASDGAVRIVLWLVLCGAALLAGAYVARHCVETGRRLDAILAIALAGVLASPISWTHHWSWIVLLPVALLARGARSRAENVALVALLVVATIAPYGWHLTGVGSVVPGFSLVAAGVLVLAVMTTVTWRRERSHHDELVLVARATTLGPRTGTTRA